MGWLVGVVAVVLATSACTGPNDVAEPSDALYGSWTLLEATLDGSPVVIDARVGAIEWQFVEPGINEPSQTIKALVDDGCNDATFYLTASGTTLRTAEVGESTAVGCDFAIQGIIADILATDFQFTVTPPALTLTTKSGITVDFVRP